MSDAIATRIKKLLNLGRANSGATEAEAETAMSMAAALMLKHGIQVQLDDDQPAPGAKQGLWQKGCDEAWHIEVASAASQLYACKALFMTRFGEVQFVGRPDAIEACEQTWVWLRDEVERLYKLNLPRGLSKIDRAEFRRTFKFACARRLHQRAWQIIERLRTDDAAAQQATGSTALVVVQSIDQQLAEAAAILEDMGVKAIKQRPKRAGTGTSAGLKAGDTVQLQKQVG